MALMGQAVMLVREEPDRGGGVDLDVEAETRTEVDLAIYLASTDSLECLRWQRRERHALVLPLLPLSSFYWAAWGRTDFSIC